MEYGSSPKDDKGVPEYAWDKDNFGLEKRSPSGRWAVLSGNIKSGDYIYRQIVLLDQKTGAFYAVNKGDACSQKLHPGDFTIAPEMEEATISIAGEARLAWVGGRDLLIVGQLLVVPGKRGYAFEGMPAMWGFRLAYPVCYKTAQGAVCRNH